MPRPTFNRSVDARRADAPLRVWNALVVLVVLLWASLPQNCCDAGLIALFKELRTSGREPLQNTAVSILLNPFWPLIYDIP